MTKAKTKTTRIPAKLSPEDKVLIEAIVERAKTVAVKMDARVPRGLSRDIIYVHTHIRALRLKDLLEADELNFTHDVWGISGKLSQKTGQLVMCFMPRFATPREG